MMQDGMPSSGATPTSEPPSEKAASPMPHPVGVARRWLYVGLGLVFVGLAVLGVFLPVLPTTPFLLLASYFFVRSSPRLNRWLLRSRLFGPYLRDWQQHRAVRPHVKIVALSVLTLAVAGSGYLLYPKWHLIGLLIVLASIGAIVVIRLPVVPRDAETDP